MKCNLTDKHTPQMPDAELCDAMKRRAKWAGEGMGKKGNRGLVLLQTVETVDGRNVIGLAGVTYKGKGQKSVMLNFCPWCGGPLRRMDEEEDDS